MPCIKVDVTNNEVIVSRNNDEAENRARHGLMRSLIANMVTGVSKGFWEKLEINVLDLELFNRDRPEV